MKTKEDFSDELNELLDTTIDFTKMTKEDLTELLGVVTKLKESPFGFAIFRKPLREIVENKDLVDRPLGDLSLGDVLGNITKGRGNRKSLFGLGIIPMPRPLRNRQAEGKE